MAITIQSNEIYEIRYVQNLYEFEYGLFTDRFNVYFNDKTDTSNPFLASIQIKNSLGQDRWINYKPYTNEKVILGYVDKNKVLYQDVFAPNINVEYEIIDGQLKENIILNSPTTLRKFEFTLKLSEFVEYNLNNLGDIIFTDTITKEELWKIPAPFMIDALGIESRNLFYSFGNKNGYLTVIVNLNDEEFLQSEAYPIKIDPTTIFNGFYAGYNYNSSVKDSIGNNYVIFSMYNNYQYRLFLRKIKPDNSQEYWNGSTFQSNSATEIPINNETSSSISTPVIAIDSADVIHIAYKSNIAGIKYIRLANNILTYDTVFTDGTFGTIPQILVDNNRNVHISYEYNYTIRTKYAKFNGSSWDSWTDVPVYTSVTVYTYLFNYKLFVDNFKNLHLILITTDEFSATHSYHFVATYNGSTWDTWTKYFYDSTLGISTSSIYASIPDAVVDSSNNIYLVLRYWMGSRYCIGYKKATYSSSTWTWDSSPKQTDSSITYFDTYSVDYPTINVDRNDYIHIMWSGVPNNGSSGNYQLFYTIYNTLGYQGIIRNITNDNSKNYNTATFLNSTYNKNSTTEFNYTYVISGVGFYFDKIAVQQNPPSVPTLTGIAVSPTDIKWDWANTGTNYMLIDSVSSITIATTATNTYTESVNYPSTSYGRKLIAYNDMYPSLPSSTANVTTPAYNFTKTLIAGVTNNSTYYMTLSAKNSMVKAPNGDIYVVGTRTSGSSNLYLRKLVGSNVYYWNGTTWVTSYTAETSISPNTNTPCINVSSNGYIHLAWRDYGTNEIKYKYYDGTTFSSVETVSSGNTNTQVQQDVTMFIDKNDNVHIAWAGIDSTVNTSYRQLKYNRKLYQGGNSWGTWVGQSRLTSAGSSGTQALLPHIVVDSNLNIYIGYIVGNANGSISCFKATYNTGSSTWDSFLSTSTVGGSSLSTKNLIALHVDKFNNIHFVATTSGLGSISHYCRYNINQTFSDWEAISTPNTLYSASITSDNVGSIYIGFHGSDSKYPTYNGIKLIKRLYKNGTWGTWSNWVSLTQNSTYHSTTFSFDPRVQNKILFSYMEQTNATPYIGDITPIPPLAPTLLNGEAQGVGTILWTWTDNSNDELEFRLKDENDNIIATIPVNTQNYLETNLSPNSYIRRLVAYSDNGGESSYVQANVTTLTLNPPTVTGSAESSSKLLWSITPYYEAIEYNLYYGGTKIGRILKEGLNWNVYLDTNPTQIAQTYTSPKFLFSRLPNTTTPLSANSGYSIEVSSVYKSIESGTKTTTSATTNPLPSFISFNGNVNGLNSLSWKVNK